jgi:tight adherence protein B
VRELDELAIIFIAIFGAVLLAVQGAYWFFTEQHRARGAVNRRLLLAQQSSSAQEIFETLKRERGLVGLETEQFRHLNDLFIQTGLRLDGKILIAVAFSLGLLLFLLLGFAFGFGPLSFILSVVCAVLVLVLVLAITRRKRIAKFSEQLPDAIDVIGRGIKAGYPFIVALALVGKEMSDPIGTEFGMTADEVSFGAEMGSALDHLAQRVGHADLLYLTMALKIQMQTGGSLAEILSRLSRLLRERAMLRLKVKALSAEGRLSAIFLTAMPFVLFGVITLLQPAYFFSVRNHPIIMPALILGLSMIGVGNVMIYRMVNFKV